MKNVIMMVSKNEYKLDSRGNKFTLLFDEKNDDWTMYVENASTRAYRTLGMSCFTSLKAVEAKYKSWAGIDSLVNC